MARIERVELTSITDTNRREEGVVAEVDVAWATEDVGRGFTLRVYLIEQDGELDDYSLNSDGSLRRDVEGFRDDIKGEITQDFPGVTNRAAPFAGVETITVSRAWDFPRILEIRNEYRAVATLRPEGVFGDVAVRPAVSSRVPLRPGVDGVPEKGRCQRTRPGDDLRMHRALRDML